MGQCDYPISVKLTVMRTNTPHLRQLYVWSLRAAAQFPLTLHSKTKFVEYHFLGRVSAMQQRVKFVPKHCQLRTYFSVERILFQLGLPIKELLNENDPPLSSLTFSERRGTPHTSTFHHLQSLRQTLNTKEDQLRLNQ